LNKAGHIRLSDSIVGGIHCDCGKNEIAMVALDALVNGIMYVATTKGEIIVFDTHTHSSKSEHIDCKMLGKISTNLSRQMVERGQLI
jgi:hypothetical protein